LLIEGLSLFIMEKIIYELSLESLRSYPGALDILKNILRNLGVKEHQLIELKDFDKSFFILYFNKKKQAQSLTRRLKKLNLKYVILRLKVVKQSEWENKWRDDFQPFSLTRTFNVVPLELKKKYMTRKTPIYLGAGLAFGTGLHATTRFMAQFIETCRGHFETFLDIGTGTGILAIMASKCGAQDIHAIDLNRDVINVAKGNFKENECHVPFLKAINFSKFNPSQQYDFVAANLITQDLIDFRPKILSLVNPGKYLAVSGISLHNYARLKTAYQDLPLRCLKIEKKEGWVGILYQKEGSL